MPYFLNVGVDNQVVWPKERQEINFEGYRLILLPKTGENTTSVHIDLSANNISLENAHTLINRFLSLLAWCDDNYAIYEGGWAGNPIPVPVRKRNLAFITAHEWPFDRKIPRSREGRLALAIYREARNAEQNQQISYAVLGYYKIIELKGGSQSTARTWIRDNYAHVTAPNNMRENVQRFDDARGAHQPHNYLYNACRSAVAHVKDPYASDPDELKEIRRLHVAAGVLRPLARHFIEKELGISDNIFDGT